MQLMSSESYVADFRNENKLTGGAEYNNPNNYEPKENRTIFWPGKTFSMTAAAGGIRESREIGNNRDATSSRFLYRITTLITAVHSLY